MRDGNEHGQVTTFLAPIAIVLAVFASAPAAADQHRQGDVEHQSERVMPFRMDATMHHFTPTASGGVQRVVAPGGDPVQVRLVREHLRKEATAFARGDYADPAAIHGTRMPGLAAMRAGAGRIAVRYADVPNGGTIAYVTRDPALISAIHAWFRAQVDDHGAHATMTM